MKKLGERILVTCALVTSRRPWLVLFLGAIVTALSFWYSSYLEMNTSTVGLLSDKLAFRQIEKKYASAFPKNESVIVIIDAQTPADADSAADNLAVRLEGLPDLFSNVVVPGAQPFFNENGLMYLEPERLGALLGEVQANRSVLGPLRTDPTLRGLADVVADANGVPAATRVRMLDALGDAAQAQADGGEDRTNWVDVLALPRPEGRPGTRRFVMAKPVLDNTSISPAGPALGALDEQIAELKDEEAEGVQIQITGDPALRQQELKDAFSGAAMASVLSFILVALSLIFGLRSGRLIIALLITLVVGGIWTTGLATLFVGQLNLISVAFMVLFIGLGVDFGTHTGLRFLEERKAGHGFETAMKAAMVGEGPAIFLSAACAALAFLSFVPTSYTGLAEFGIISALGMVVAVVITFTIQPALMAVMPPKVPRWGDVHFGIGGWINRHYRKILVVSGLLTVGALFAATGARVDVNPLNLQNPNAPPVVAYHSLENDPRTSPYSINVVAADEEDARKRAAVLAAIPGVERVATFEAFLPTRQQEKLDIVADARRGLGASFFSDETSPAPTPAELSQSFEALRASAAQITDQAPEGSDLRNAATKLLEALAAFAGKRGSATADLAALQDALIGSLPQIASTLGERLQSARILGADDLPEEIRRDWVTKDGRVRLQVQPAGIISTPEGFEEFADKIQAVEPEAAGVPISITDAGAAILQSFAEAVLYTTIAIGLIVYFLRRRLSDVVLIMLPLALASAWTVAGSAVLDLPFNFANVIVIPLLIGLGVAGSIHIVVRHRELERINATNKDVLGTSTSLAVLVAQLNNVAAFATLAISEHRGLYSMGLLLGLAVLLTVVVCIIVLPAILVAYEKWKTARSLKRA